MADRWRQDICIEGYDANGPVPRPRDGIRNVTAPSLEEHLEQRGVTTRSTPAYRAPVFSGRDVERLQMSMDLVLDKASAVGNDLLDQLLPREKSCKKSFIEFFQNIFKKVTGKEPSFTQAGFISMGRTVFPRFTSLEETRFNYRRIIPNDRCKFTKRHRNWYRSHVRCGDQCIDGRPMGATLPTIFELPEPEE